MHSHDAPPGVHGGTLDRGGKLDFVAGHEWDFDAIL
jgi:hypothetical protein